MYNEKVLKILGVFVLICIIIAIIIKVPVKKALKIELKFSEQESISMNDKLLICGNDNTVTGTPWFVVGKNNKLFTNNEPNETIILEGNFPKSFLLSKMTNSPAENKFIFEGGFVGNKKDKYEGGVYKVFKVKKWSIVYPIDREYGFVENLPKARITIYDYLPFP